MNFWGHQVRTIGNVLLCTELNYCYANKNGKELYYTIYSVYNIIYYIIYIYIYIHLSNYIYIYIYIYI